MGREGAGQRAWQTRRENQMLAKMAELRAQYDSRGKREIRRLLLGVAKATGCSTWLELLGGGAFAEQLTREGFRVTAAESNPSLRSFLHWSAGRFGVKAHAGLASRTVGQFDVVFADLCGPLADGRDRSSEPEVHRLALKALKWIAITVNPDRQRDPLLKGGSGRLYADATMAARLVAITGCRLQYFRRYQRNEFGQWMWFAILKAHVPGVGTHCNIDPASIQYNMDRRGYWASDGFRRSFADLLPHKWNVVSARAREKWNTVQRLRYADPTSEYHLKTVAYRNANRARQRERAREWYYANRDRILAANAARRGTEPGHKPCATRLRRSLDGDIPSGDGVQG